MHGRGPNAFQKPPSVTFSFRQKRFDKSGDIVDDRGQTVYRLKDTGDEHSFGFIKSYPLEVYRAYGNSLACTIDWHSGPKKTTVTGLTGKPGELLFLDGLMDNNLKWYMPDGSQFEWDGTWGYSFNLLDYRIQQLYSLSPAVVAKYVPRPSKKEYTTLEVHRDALNVPGFLDYLVATVIWLEWKLYDDIQKRKDAAAGKKFGNELGNAFATDGGDGGGGGGGDGGGGGV